MPAASESPLPSPPPQASFPLLCRPPEAFPPDFNSVDLVAARNRLVASAAAAAAALLRLPSRAFWAAVLNLSATPSDFPPQLPWLAFIDAYLRAHADAAAFTAPPLFADHGAGPAKLPTGESTAPTKTDIVLSRRVLLLIRRLAIDYDAVKIRPGSSTGTNAGWHARLDDGDAWTPIPGHPMTLVRLLDTLRVYSHTNRDLTTELVKVAFSRFPTLGRDLEAAQQHVGDRVHSLLRHVAKRSKSKGKGKGAAVSESLQGASEADVEAEFSEDIAAITFALLDLQALALSDDTAAPVTSAMLENSFIASLLGCYDAVNQITAVLPSPPNPPVSDSPLDPSASSLTLGLRRLKLACISLLFSLLSVLIFEHRFSSSDVLVDRLCDALLQCLEPASALDPGPLTFLGDAPLLLDLDIEFDVHTRLRRLRDRVAETAADSADHGDSNPRVEYLLGSLEQLVAFSGNAETKRLRANKRQRAAAAAAAAAAKADGKLGAAGADDVEMEDANDGARAEEDYVRRTMLISQVQDLFPDLGEGFIEACLIALSEDPELTIMRILEDNIPDVVSRLDRNMPRTAPVPRRRQKPQRPTASTEAAAPQALLAARRNVFDGDAFDVFAGNKPDMERVVFGKK
ncbi:Activating signal cointegrator 1 complex subunit 2, partial [Cladochytrium tenue]